MSSRGELRAVDGGACGRCGRLGGGPRYRLDGRPREGGAVAKVTLCWRCACRNSALLWRSLRVALVVGTLLNLANQGPILFGEEAPSAHLLWKVPFTFAVPFFVATYGALANAREPLATGVDPGEHGRPRRR